MTQLMNELININYLFVMYQAIPLVLDRKDVVAMARTGKLIYFYESYNIHQFHFIIFMVTKYHSPPPRSLSFLYLLPPFPTLSSPFHIAPPFPDLPSPTYLPPPIFPQLPSPPTLHTPTIHPPTIHPPTVHPPTPLHLPLPFENPLPNAYYTFLSHLELWTHHLPLELSFTTLSFACLPSLALLSKLCLIIYCCVKMKIIYFQALVKQQHFQFRCLRNFTLIQLR